MAWNDWVCSINGERLFLKGANLLPTRPGPRRRHARPTSAATSSWPSRPGSTSLRVQAHIAGHELYRAADELGVLLLQDFPLQWGYARQIRREAVRQAREAVDALGHHPSIVQWCAHDEPVAEAPQVETDRRSRRLRRFVAQQLPTWNKSVLDRWVKRAFEQADPTRPTVAHGGVAAAPAPARRHRLAHVARLAPRRGRRAGRAGPRCCRASCASSASSAPSRCPPTPSGFVDTSRWPELDWDDLREHHGLEVEVMLAAGAAATITRRSAPGARRPSATRRRSCATTSRRCAG